MFINSKNHIVNIMSKLVNIMLKLVHIMSKLVHIMNLIYDFKLNSFILHLISINYNKFQVDDFSVHNFE